MKRQLVPLVLLLALAGCGDGGDSVTGSDAAELTYRETITKIQDAVTVWERADSIEQARASAEAAANLVVGPGGPGYGDRDGNGTIDGAIDFGVLAGLDGSPDGVASALALADNQCIVDDVLGGSWTDPSNRWAEMQSAIDQWSPDNNTMPSLASHPMRVVGWATFTLASDSLDDAHEYGGHAQLHVDTSLAALDC